MFNSKIKDDATLLLDRLVGTINARIAFFDPQYTGVLEKMQYGNEGERQQGRAEQVAMTPEVIRQIIQGVYKVLAPSGYLFLWVDKFHLVEGCSDWWSGTDFLTVDMVTWDKVRIGMGYRTRRRSEYLLVLQKPPKLAKVTWTRHDIPDVWGEKQVDRDKNHPHKKPLGLIKALIDATTQPGDIVLDPAAGSFVVLDACLQTERLFLGCDLVHGDVLPYLLSEDENSLA